MHELRFLTVEQVTELIDLWAKRSPTGAAGPETAASVEERVAELSADQQSELYALYLLGRERDARPKALDRLTERARAFSNRAGSFPTRQRLATNLRKGLEKLGILAARHGTR